MVAVTPASLRAPAPRRTVANTPARLLLALLAVLVLALLPARALAQEAPAPEPELPLVYHIATGGTIAGLTAGDMPWLGLLEEVPQATDHVRIEGERVANTGSSNITLEILLTLANRINELFETRPDIAGIVVTHGTDTIEETAYFLNLVVKSDKPVVLVGAMRSASQISSDGAQNLFMGYLTAVSPLSVGRGVMVLLNDQIHAARDVHKTNTYSVDTFESEYGPLGYIRDTSGPRFYVETTRRHTIASEFDVTGFTVADLPRVDIVYAYLGADATQVNAAVAAGARGIAVATVGAGNAPNAMSSAYNGVYASDGVIVVRSSRTGTGLINPSSGNNLNRGVVGADNLNVNKARILLMLALTVTDDPAEIQRIFNEY